MEDKLYKFIPIYLFISFLQPERFLTRYLGFPKVLNGLPTGCYFIFLFLVIINFHVLGRQKVPLLRNILMFAVCLGISAYFAQNTGRARSVLIQIINFSIVLYILIQCYMLSYKEFDKLIKLYLFCLLVLAVFAVKEGFRLRFIPQLDDEDAIGPLFGAVSAIPALLVSTAKGKQKIVYLFLYGLFSLLAIFSVARGAIIAYVVVQSFVFWKSPKKLRNVVLITVVCLFSLTLFYKPIMNSQVMSEVASIFTEQEMVKKKEGTGASRIFLWTMGLKMWQKSPFIGVGALNFGVHLPDYSEKYWHQKVGRAYYGQIIHNDYLEILVGTGSIGFIFFMILFIKSFLLSRKTRSLLNKIGEMQRKAVNTGQKLEDKFRINIEKYSNLTYSLQLFQICMAINMLFYGIIYYQKYYWFYLIIVISLNVVTEKKYNEFSEFLKTAHHFQKDIKSVAFN